MTPDLTYHRQVQERIRPYVNRTPVLTSSTLNEIVGGEIFFKSEHLQRMGAFKMRGAMNAAMNLPVNRRSAGLCTHSSGNHGQAVALAAKSLGIPAYVVVPENIPEIKLNALRAYGAQITFCAPTQEERERVSAEVARKTGAHFIHPSNDPDVIWGQGTAALELLDEVPSLDTIVVSVGGGGLIAGTSLAAKAINSDIRIIGAEPEIAADAKESLESGRIVSPYPSDTIADGLRTGLGNVNFPVIREHVGQILTVGEEDIRSSTRWVWERMKQLIEPSAGVAVAALTTYPEEFRNRRTGVILCGGNTDLTRLPF